MPSPGCRHLTRAWQRPVAQAQATLPRCWGAPVCARDLSTTPRRDLPEATEANGFAGMERKQMNLFTALNDAMRIALETDDTAVRAARAGAAHTCAYHPGPLRRAPPLRSRR